MSATLSNQVDSVERVYAQALIDIADEAGHLAQMAQQLEELRTLLDAHPDLLRLLASRVVPTRERANSIKAIFEGRISDTLYRFLQVINEKGRLVHLPGMIRAYAHLLDERNGIAEVDVFVADPLGESQIQKVADVIGGVVGCQVVLHQHVDPHLIGGLKVRVGDRLIDGSVATGLRLMHNRLTDVGHERARTDLGLWIQE